MAAGEKERSRENSDVGHGGSVFPFFFFFFCRFYSNRTKLAPSYAPHAAVSCFVCVAHLIKGRPERPKSVNDTRHKK